MQEMGARGPVDRILRPTEAGSLSDETLSPWAQGPSCTKNPGPKTWFIVQEMGLEPQ